ncbi:MAG TPA: coproporphyrinogen dehydrogenase HemZ [Verrucomicrobiae bacterium]|nr:coproporphyrinogen dehydrogenase HemZ [Verrucomicrobiae bacterium]
MKAVLKGPVELTGYVKDLCQLIPMRENPFEVELTTNFNSQGPEVVCVLRDTVRMISARVVKQLPLRAENEQKRIIRMALAECILKMFPNLSLPWGILTGIRPTKIIHRLLDQGLGDRAIHKHLAANLLVSREKADLSLGIAALQRKYLLKPEDARGLVSVYVGIPFCPSRCLYCSFPSYTGTLTKLDGYLEVLNRELAEMGRELSNRGLKVQTVYIGGGTPTVLSGGQLERLLSACNTQLVSPATVEVTVEAGRPDTLNKEKLVIMHNHGVNRLSINPQTMSEATLVRIGREHSPEDIIKSFYLAREIGFDNINMDIILGLPGEDICDVQHTLEEIGKLSPDSFTAHALAIKKGAPISQLGYEARGEGSLMHNLAAEAAESMGMRPYYLYRQKRILDNLENIGYAKPGKESIYNIQIMEERQSILAVGAGGASKIVNPRDWSLTNLAAPKQPEAYYLKWQQLLQEKFALLDKVLEIN